jgi:hypothetical protein
MFIHGRCTYSTISYCSLFNYVVNIGINFLFLHECILHSHTKYKMYHNDKHTDILCRLSFRKLFTFFPRAEAGHSEQGRDERE